MKAEEAIWRLIAVYKGKDGYGYGTAQTKTVKKEFASLTELRKWVGENCCVDEFSGFGVTTRLSLCSYKTYRIECVESYEDGRSYKSYAYNREFNVGDEVFHVVSDVRVTSPLKGIVMSISCGRYIERSSHDAGAVMTQEQYNRAVWISKRLEELEKVKDEIKETTKHRLWYAYKGSDWMLEPEWEMRYIDKLLDKHDLMIRQEIDDEINNLKKEIETL